MRQFIIYFSLILFSSNSLTSQNITYWRVSNYSNNELLDTCHLVVGNINDTEVYFMPGVVYIGKCQGRVLIVDFDEQTITHLPIMQRDLQLDQGQMTIENLFDSLELESKGKLVGDIDTFYDYKYENKDIKYKMNHVNEIVMIETTNIIVKPGTTHEFDISKTVYEAMPINKMQSYNMSHYIYLRNKKWQPTAKYLDWEFIDLTQE